MPVEVGAGWFPTGEPFVLAEPGMPPVPPDGLLDLPALDLVRQVASLNEALRTSRLVSYAVGIIMVRSGVDRDGAFDLMRRASQRTHRKVRDLAAEILEHHEQHLPVKTPA